MSSVTTVQEPKLRNYVNGAWRASTATEFVEVINPATAEVLRRTGAADHAGERKDVRRSESGIAARD